MLINSEAIILNHIRFSERDLIVKVLTKKRGLISFLVKGGQKKKKNYLQQLMIVNISFNFKLNKNLHYIKNIELKSVPNKILISHRKRNAVLFLCEIISRILKEGSDEERLYEYIEKSISYLNSDLCSGKFFDIWFLLNLTKFLGVAPELTGFEKNSNSVFCPETGGFILFKGHEKHIAWNKEHSLLLYNFLCANVEEIENFSLSYSDYKSLIENILHYYSLHVSSFNYKKLLAVYTELL